ncbi:MAG: hypothetical protein ACH350_06925 [Parachlamydiaceae bacterium]
MMSININLPFEQREPLSPSSVQLSPSRLQSSKQNVSPSKVASVLFSTSTAIKEPKIDRWTIKPIPISGSLLKELEKILNSQAEQINQKLKELEDNEIDKQLGEAIIDIEGWGYELTAGTNEKVQSGVDFLKNILPNPALNKILSTKNLQLKKISDLTTNLLACLDIGARGAALLCKINILNQSKELLQECKEHLLNKKNETDDPIKKEGDQTSETSIANIQKIITEWESQIAAEERGLSNEKADYLLTVSFSGIEFISDALLYIPNEMICRGFSFSKVLPWFLSGVEFIGQALQLKSVREEGRVLKKWKESYQKWLGEHRPEIVISDNKDMNRDIVSSEDLPLHSHQQHQDMLFKGIETKGFYYIQKKLKECGVKLPPSLASNESLALYLREHPKIVKKYTIFQRRLETLNIAIMTSRNLLTKRKSIVEKKVLLFESNFETIKTQIEKKQKETLIKEIKQLFNHITQDPTYQIIDIENVLMKWEFFNSPISPKNVSLLSAFTELKQSKIENIEKNDPIDSHQNNFLKQLIEWSNDPASVDHQFEVWFKRQNKKNLIRDYIDHQETIEHTIKNSLKQMVEKKHELETHCLKFKSTTTHLHFTASTVSLTASIIFAILGLLTIPFGGAGLILLALSVGSIALSIGLFVAGSLHARKYKAQTTALMTFFFRFKMAWANLRHSIAHYSHQAKEKKQVETAKILYELYQSHLLNTNTITGTKSKKEKYRKALTDFHRAKLDLEQSQKKVEGWAKKMRKLESRLNNEEWKDFSQYASLPMSEDSSDFDTLEAFQSAFESCDLRLLNKETKQLLEVQLGVDLDHLQAQIQKDPQEIKKSLQEFFALSDAKLIYFIRHQQKRIQLGLLT